MRTALQDNVRYHGRRGKITSFGLAFLCVLFLCVKTAMIENYSFSNILVTGYCREQERMDFIMYDRFEVGERLMQVREEHGYSQDWLAEKGGVFRYYNQQMGERAYPDEGRRY
jgi:hypothetical protein